MQVSVTELKQFIQNKDDMYNVLLRNQIYLSNYMKGIMGLHNRPKVLCGVEGKGVRRKILEMQVGMVIQEILHKTAMVYTMIVDNKMGLFSFEYMKELIEEDNKSRCIVRIFDEIEVAKPINGVDYSDSCEERPLVDYLFRIG